MIQFDSAKFVGYSIHRLSADDANCLFSTDTKTPWDPFEEKFFLKLLLKPLTNNTNTLEFLNQIEAKNLYEEWLADGDFGKVSELGARLIAQNIQLEDTPDSELFVAEFDEVLFENLSCKALGFFMFQNKEDFIETKREENQIETDFRSGLSSKKPDAYVLILDTGDGEHTILKHSSGYVFWDDTFACKAKKDHINQTQNFLTMTKKFITEELPENFEISKTDQIDLLNRSVDYFKNNEVFEKDSFQEEVFHDEKVIKTFKNFDQTYSDVNEVEMSASFEISPQAVKKQARVFKSVLKLDKNFHIYIHGNRQLIEKGVDEQGRKYYRIFYDNEE